jgi:hypothetical protein
MPFAAGALPLNPVSGFASALNPDPVFGGTSCREGHDRTQKERLKGRERGSAVVLFLALLSIMLVLVAANGRTLLLLKKDLQVIEHRQIQRLEHSQSDSPPVLTPAPAGSQTPP